MVLTLIIPLLLCMGGRTTAAVDHSYRRLSSHGYLVEECDPKTVCKKSSTEMKFKITGGACEESTNYQDGKFVCDDSATIGFPAYIKLSANGDVYYENMVSQGDVIIISNGGDKFASDTDVVLKTSPSGMTYQSFTFHTSCSKNLSLGDTFGGIQLLGFTNKDQGTVACEPVCEDKPVGEFLWKIAASDDSPVTRTCAWLADQEECDIKKICVEDDVSLPGFLHATELCPETCLLCPPEDCHTECLERPTKMEFKVSDGDCAEGTNDQEGKYECADLSSIQFPAKVLMKSAKSDDVYYNNVVYGEGDVVEASNGGDEFDADMTVEISGLDGSLYQVLQYHSSCSKNLFIGDIFGGVQLVSFTNEVQGKVDICVPKEFPPCENEDCPIDPLPEEPFSNEDLDDIYKCCFQDDPPPKDLCCSFENPPDYCEAPSAPPTPQPTPKPSPTPSIIPSIEVTPDCEECDPYEDPWCEYECPPDVCEVRPELFYFKFSGGSCEDSDNSQPSKFTCDDKGTINKSRSYYLVFTSAKSDAEEYYKGWVSPGEVVTLKHNGKFQSDMRVDIYAGKMKWMVQTLVYHSSCSQNLFNGDVFGGVTLMGFKSHYQHSLCRPTNCDKDPTPDCDPDTDPDCEEPCEPTMCEKRPDEFYFKLTSGSCGESDNSQGDKFSCYEMGSYNDAKGKYLEFTDTSGYETYFQGFVIPDGTMKLVSPSNKFPADMRVRIYTAPNKKYMLQDIQYHSSCSKNLYTGDSFGAVTLVGFKSDYQDVKCE